MRTMREGLLSVHNSDILMYHNDMRLEIKEKRHSGIAFSGDSTNVLLLYVKRIIEAY